MIIPASVWQAEKRYRKIWEGKSACVRCGFRERDLLCPQCMEPFCAVCLQEHKAECAAKKRRAPSRQSIKARTHSSLVQ